MNEGPENASTENTTLPAILALLLIVLPPLAIALHPLANNDLPMHLAIGEWIFEFGKLPSEDPFSGVH